MVRIKSILKLRCKEVGEKMSNDDNTLLEILKELKDIRENNERILREYKSLQTKIKLFSDPNISGAYRSNFKIISSPMDPVYSATIHYGGVVNTNFSQLYTITAVTTVAANGFLVMQLTNPANSNKAIRIDRVSGGASVNTTFDTFKNATFSVTPTILTVLNRNWGSGNTSVMTAKYAIAASGADPTTGGTLMSSVIQTGGPVSREYDGEFYVPYGSTDRQFYVRLTNNTAASNLVALNITWEETVLT
jgi:hypothetical protein